MKSKSTLLTLLCLAWMGATAFAQDCSVSISGNNCTASQLNAVTSGDALARITWFQYTNNVYEADTVSSPTSKSIVAGNNGSGTGAGQFGFPAGGIAVDASANIYVADTRNNRVQKWAPGAFTGTTVAGGNGAGSAANQLSSPSDVFVDAAGNIYVADAGNNRIQKWLPGATSGITVAGGNGNGSAANQLNTPKGVFADNNGNILIADTYNYRVQLWRKNAVTGTTVAGGNGYGTAANQFTNPIDIYADASRNIYIADANTENSAYHRVQKWKLGQASGVTVAADFGFLLAIYVDAAGNLYTADNGISGTPVSLVKKWAPGATHGVTVAGGHATGWDVLSYPTGVALDKLGNIYVLDGTYNPRVQKYVPINGVVDTRFTPSQPGQYTVRVTYKNGCTVTSDAVIVRAKPGLHEIYATEPRGNTNLCDGGRRTFFVNQWDEITAYNWQVPAGCTILSNNNDSITIQIPAGFDRGFVKVVGTNTCGLGQPSSLVLLGRPPVPGNVKGPQQVYPGQQGVVFTATAAGGGLLQWIVPQGATIVAGQGSGAITVNWGSTAGNVEARAYNDCGISAPKSLQVSLQTLVAAVHSNAVTLTDIKEPGIFPNPANHIANIRFTAGRQTSYNIRLQQLNGAMVWQSNISAQKGINNIPVDVSKYASGIYLVTIRNATEKISFKLIRQ